MKLRSHRVRTFLALCFEKNSSTKGEFGAEELQVDIAGMEPHTHTLLLVSISTYSSSKGENLPQSYG